MTRVTLNRNQRNGHNHGRKSGAGPRHPPRNNVTPIAATVTVETYSPRKNIANVIPEYSVWNPATSSVSASARSNGGRFVSAIPQIRYTTKAGNIGTTFHTRSCAATISENARCPLYISTATSERPIATSYEIIWAEDRTA